MATVLIVEDQAQILALVQSLLEEEGHKIFTTSNVDAAVVILAGPEPLDAFLVDIILNQDMQAGIELAKRAVALRPGLKVVYSTGVTLTDRIRALLVPGAVVLEKPYKLDQLLTSLLERRVRD
jgi:DNA-binding NtrC family response regulator